MVATSENTGFGVHEWHKIRSYTEKPNILYLSYDVASESVMKPCIKNDNPLVD